MARPKRRTVGDNALHTAAPPTASRAVVAETAPPKQPKERMTFHLPVEVMERAKNAVYWTPGLTLADLAAQALTDAVDRLENKKGEPFAPRKSELKGGRPMK
jgi:hypothetical protein